MATVTAYDPREDIRQTIGTERYIRGTGDAYCLSVTNDKGDTVYVPLYKPQEVYCDNPPELPFIQMNVVTTPASTMNVGGDIHKSEAYIDFNITYLPTTDKIDNEFGEDVASAIVDAIMDDRSCNTIGFFVEVINDGREYFEGSEGRGVVFHRVVEIYAYKTQKK